MALITRFDEVTADRQVVHGPVECGWRSFTSNGERILQLDTYGSAERKLQGKTSQSIQLDEKAARQLAEILDRAFPRRS
jgi:hypothetical protein